MNNPHIPHHMRDNILHFARLTGQPADLPKYLVFTRQHQLHIVRHQNVLATCVLSSVVPPAAAPHLAHNITLDVRYTYTPLLRRMHILLLIGRHFAVVNKSSRESTDTLEITYTAEDIREFTVVPVEGDDDEDENGTVEDAAQGQVNVCLTATSGEMTVRSLRQIAATPKRPTYTVSDESSSASGNRTANYGPIVQTMEEALRKGRSDVAAQQLHNERLALQLAEVQRFGPASQRGHVVDEKMMLARYGDVWWRAHNGCLVIGVPVFNCTFKRKRILLNVRLVLHAPHSPTPRYTYQLFDCRLDVIVLPHLDGGDLDTDDCWQRLTFEHEWEKTDHLLPETAAMLVATLDLPVFDDSASTELALNCFVVYDIEDEAPAGNSRHSLQLSCGELRIAADVLFSAPPTFAPASCFRDLLAVRATTPLRWSLLWRFANAASASSTFAQLLVDGMGFRHVLQPGCGAVGEADETGADAMDVDRYINDIVGSAPHRQSPVTDEQPRLRSSDLFYCDRDYFKGILIRRHRRPAGLEHELNVYGNCGDQLQNFVQCLRRYAGRENVVRLPVPNVDGSVDALQRCVLDEMRFLRGFDYGAGTADTFRRERASVELLTDLSVIRARCAVRNSSDEQ